MALRVIAGIGLAIVLNEACGATTSPEGNYVGQDKITSRARLERVNFDHHHRERHRNHVPTATSEIKMIAGLRREVRDLREQVIAVVRLKEELSAIKDRVSDSARTLPIWGGPPLGPDSSLKAQPNPTVNSDLLTMYLPNLHDLAGARVPQRSPSPTDASLPAVIKEEIPALSAPRSAVEEAKTYLMRTATPGYTMTRQGVGVSIDRLHPGFVVKLAEAIRQARDAGMSNAGLYSAYRPPAYRIGGFKDKFNSLHSYGLAVDMTGIGRPRSAFALLWSKIVAAVGLYLPYGPNNRREFNHTQFVATKVAPRPLRLTITADGPRDLEKMWLASGRNEYVREALTARVSEVVNAQSTVPVDQNGHNEEVSATPPTAPPRKSRSPRRRSSSRAKSGGKRGVDGRAARTASKPRDARKAKTSARSRERQT